MRSSSAALHKRWGVRTRGVDKPPKEKPTYIDFSLTDKLRQNIQKEVPTAPLIPNGPVSVEHLSECFDTLLKMSKKKSLTTNQKTMLEEYRLALMEAMHKHLSQYVWKAGSTQNKKVSKKSRILKSIQVVLLFIFSVIKLLQTVITEFIGFKSLLLFFIPTLASPLLLGIALSMTVVSVILFFAMQASMFRDKFGISLARNLKRRFEIYNDEVRTTQKLNEMLGNLNTHHITRQEYKECAALTVKFNRYIAVKKQKFSTYKEHPAKKAFRYGVLGFGAIMMIAGSYFGAVALLMAIASALVGTPVGWIIVGLLVATSLAFYFSGRDDAMTYLLNPIKKQFDKVNKRIKRFEVVDEDTFETLTEKAEFKHEGRRLRDSTSTEGSTSDKSDDLEPVMTRPAQRSRSFSLSGLPSMAINNLSR
jgi:hypothetical protein